MQIGNIGRALVSGGIIYVVMAACSSNDGSLASSDIADAGNRASGGSGNDDRDLYADASQGQGEFPDGSDGAGGNWLDAALDAITDPVPDAAAAEDGTKDGSRLKARYYVSDDGARQFAVWFDTHRGEECSFQMAADGKRRCMPIARVGGGSWYADSACSQPLGTDSYGCTSTGYGFVAQSTGACTDATIRIYPIVSAFSGTFYFRNNGVCTAYAGSVSGLVRFGAEIPATSFVAATLQ